MLPNFHSLVFGFAHLLVIALAMNGRQGHAAFPLPIPVRPTSFPLKEPSQAGSVVAWGRNTEGQTNVPAGLTNAVAVAAGGSSTVVLRQGGVLVAWGDSGNGQTSVPSGLTNVVAVTLGNAHALALKQDGTIVAWGNNAFSQTNPPNVSTGIVAIAAGASHSVVLSQTGGVVAWGNNSFGQTTVPTGLSGVVSVAAGSSHTVALKEDGTVVGWGSNFYGQTNVPPGLKGVVAIAAGQNHTVALRQDGSVVAWGDNTKGQTTAPAGLSNVVAVSAGYAYTLALKEGGAIAAWGDDSQGQLILPLGGTNIIAMSAGYYHAAALATPPPIQITTQPAGLMQIQGGSARLIVAADSSAPVGYQWQKNGTNVVGATNSFLSLTNLTIADEGDYKVIVYNWGRSVSSSEAHLEILGITKQPISQEVMKGSNVTFTIEVHGVGIAYQWFKDKELLPGANGKSLTLTNVQAINDGAYKVVLSKNELNFESQVATLTAHDFWLPVPTRPNSFPLVGPKRIGTVVAWGDNPKLNIPADLKDAVAVAAGSSHGVALRIDGTVIAWGNNVLGQTNVPQTLNGVVAISAGDSHSLALRNDGTVLTWGTWDRNGQQPAKVPAGLSNVVFIAAGPDNDLAVKQDGTVVAWGVPTVGASLPAGLSNVVAVSAGSWHAFALRQDGTVVGWGDTSWGKIDQASQETNVVAIAAGATNGPSVGLKQNGTVVFWGRPYVSLPYPPLPNITNAIAMAAGYSHTAVLLADGTIRGWGAEGSGPVGLNGVFAISVAYSFTHTLALTAVTPVKITQPPSSVSVVAGGTAQLSVTADGSGPLYYQWQKDGSAVPGATNRDLTLVNVGPSSVGNYSVTVSNSFFNASSTNAFLNVVSGVTQIATQVPVTGLSADHEGFARWNVTNAASSAELQRTGHELSWLRGLPPGTNYYAPYYLASREYGGIDPLSTGAFRFQTPASGFTNFTVALNANGFTLADVKIRFGLMSLGADATNVDWSFDGTTATETRRYTGGRIRFLLAGEEMLAGPMPNLTYTIRYRDLSNSADDQIFGSTGIMRPTNNSSFSSVAVKTVVSAFLQDLGSGAIRLVLDSIGLENQSGFVQPSTGRLGGFAEVQNSRIELLKGPVFVEQKLTANGQFRMQLSGGSDSVAYVIEATDDLKVWTAIRTNTTSNGDLVIYDNDIVGHRFRFYRAKYR